MRRDGATLRPRIVMAAARGNQVPLGQTASAAYESATALTLSCNASRMRGWYRAEGFSSQEKLLLWRWVMRDAQGMAHRSPLEIPGDLRPRLEVARLDLLALFRALDRMDLSAEEIPQRLLRQLFERDADYAEALRSEERRVGKECRSR